MRVQMRADAGAVSIGIQDNGFGFRWPKQIAPGRRFFASTDPGAVTGAGLGLAIASSLIRRMGGSLNVTGKQGEGALAEIKLRAA